MRTIRAVAALVAGVSAVAVPSAAPAVGEPVAVDETAAGPAVDPAGAAVPWMLVSLADGSMQMRWGAVRPAFLAAGTTIVASGGGSGATAQQAAAALAVECFLTVGNVSKPSTRLTSSVTASCSSGFGTMLAESYFQYKYLTFYRRRSATVTHPSTTRSPATWLPSLGCASGASVHKYRLRARGYSTALGFSPWYSGRTSGDLACGT